MYAVMYELCMEKCFMFALLTLNLFVSNAQNVQRTALSSDWSA